MNGCSFIPSSHRGAEQCASQNACMPPLHAPGSEQFQAACTTVCVFVCLGLYATHFAQYPRCMHASPACSRVRTIPGCMHNSVCVCVPGPVCHSFCAIPKCMHASPACSRVRTIPGCMHSSVCVCVSGPVWHSFCAIPKCMHASPACSRVRTIPGCMHNSVCLCAWACMPLILRRSKMHVCCPCMLQGQNSSRLQVQQ